MFHRPLFWILLFCQFNLFIYLTNRISFHPMGWTKEWLWTLVWSLFFLAALGIPDLFLAWRWDFHPGTWWGLPGPARYFTGACFLGTSWLWIDHSRWSVRRRPVQARKLREEKASMPPGLRPPFAPLERLGFRNQIYEPRIVEYEVSLEGWPEAFSGLSLVQLTDIHHGKYIHREYLEAVVRAAEGLKPDFYALTGDFISHRKDIPGLKGLFKGLKARLGTYALMGNHDYWADGVEVRKALEGDGVRVLRNEAVFLRRRGKKLALMGVDDYWMGRKDEAPILQAAAEADAGILLAHHPDHFYLAKKAGIPLQVSGHCHGGQVCFPLLGPLIVPSSHGRKYASGFIREKNSVLFISRGIGCFPPLRTFCPPEIVKLVLKPA